MPATHCIYSVAFFLIFCISHSSFSQSYTILGQEGNRIPLTSAPFLRISPDARAAGMGETGVATSADANSAYWNPAKMVRLEENLSISYSFTPWLRKVVNDMFLQHAAVAFKLRSDQALGFSVTQLNLGDIQMASPTGALLQIESPNEMAVSFFYSYSFNENLSLGTNAKFITVSHDRNSATSLYEAIDNVAIDLGALYQKETTVLGGDGFVNLGMTITNLGPKMEYLEAQLFLPATLKLGTAVGIQLGANHCLSWSVDISKLLVPSPPVYATDDNGQRILTNPSDPDSPPVIARGKDPNRAWLSGTFGSFTDAPDGLSEEIQEVVLATGLEYWFMDMVALRGGYYREAIDKGNRQHFTVGLGGRYKLLGLDLAYLFPQGLAGRNHPLQDTFRFSLMLRMGDQTR